MNRTRTFGVALGAALVMAPIGAVLAPSAALASLPGTNGRIFFDGGIPSSSPHQSAIWSVNPDGSDLKQLTSGSDTALGPHLSPDGTKIVYSSGSGTDTAELWLMNADGTGQHQLTHDNTRDWYPTWSPDGRTIAFRSNQTGDGDIYTISPDGGPETRLTTAPGLDSLPAYSPDGSKILFHSTREDPNPSTCVECVEGVFVMNADGTGQTRLAGGPDEQDRFPNWSPDGRHIVYSHTPVAGPLGDDDGLYIADADGSDATKVNGPSSDASSGDFSPDGQQLVYEENGEGLYTVPVTGGTPRTIVTGYEANPGDAQWSSQGVTSPAAAIPTISFVGPTFGPEAGGTTVNLDGQHFLGATAVMFGSTPATSFSVTSDAELTAVAPPGTGQVDISVVNAAGPSAPSDQSGYFYNPPVSPAPAPPTVTGVSPTSGETGGGTSVVITGTNLGGATAVNFGSTPASSFTQDSDTQITAVSPAGSGTVDVTVSTANGTSATSTADQFTYTDPTPPVPQVTGISPSAGPRTGGTTVTLSGTGFAGATKVTVGGVKARFSVVDDTTISLKTPASSTTGARQIRVTGPGGTSATGAASSFTYGNPPVVSRISPTSGSIRGGTVVTVTGSGFGGTTVVHFGTRSGTKVRVVSATRITVTSPAGPVGTVDVRVSDPYGTSPAGGADRFQYKRP